MVFSGFRLFILNQFRLSICIVVESHSQQQFVILKYSFLTFDHIYLKLCHFSALDAEGTSF